MLLPVQYLRWWYIKGWCVCNSTASFDLRWSVYQDNLLTAKVFIIGIFTHMKLCLADAIHKFMWVKIIQSWQNRGQLFWNFAVWCQVSSSTCRKERIYYVLIKIGEKIIGLGYRKVNATRTQTSWHGKIRNFNNSSTWKIISAALWSGRYTLSYLRRLIYCYTIIKKSKIFVILEN